MEPEIVIVGAGVAGSALAIMLGRQGHQVLLLEKSLVHADRVRGEVLVPWGVAETQRLGLVDVLLNIDDVGYYHLPQGQGRARLYAAHGLEQKGRFAGNGRPQRFIEAFDHPAMPHRTCLRQVKVAGPCRGYANSDVWLDRIIAAGIVLIGDAAGTNDPSIAQRLSLSFRDVRLVSEALASGLTNCADGLAAYVEERHHRMSRYRLLGHLVGRIRFEFTNEAHARRQRIAARMVTEPDLSFPHFAQLKGYEAVPRTVFTDEYRERALR